ncbi:MAG TPA: PH domain-containing protein [Pirellulales bacterium]|nr:PH domain-containing protein [Pirellulales bacterium]
MLHRAKNDGWVNWVAGLAGLAMAVAGVGLVYNGVEIAFAPELLVLSLRTTPFMLLLGALLPVFGVCLIWCLLATCYEISFENLIVQSGPSLRRIPLDSIVAARISRGGLPRGPIGSRQMVRIDHRKGNGDRVGSIVISPRDPTAFLESLAQAAPALRRQADRSLRAEA